MFAKIGKAFSAFLSPKAARKIEDIRIYAHGYYGMNVAAYPATIHNVTQYLNRGLSDIMATDNWQDHYDHTTWMLERKDSNGAILSTSYQKITSITDFVTWVNANLGHSQVDWTEYLHITVFDELDNSMKPIEIYGLNRSFGVIKGRRNQRSRYPKYCNSADCAWDYLDDFVYDSFRQAHGIDISPMTEAKINMVWFSQNMFKRWGLPKAGTDVKFETGFTPGRYMYDIATTTPVLHTGQALSVGDPMYCSVVADGDSWFWASSSDFDIVQPKTSTLVVYPLSVGNYRALLIKPYCVDSLSLSPFLDLSLYRIEYVTMNRDNSIRIRVADTSNAVYDVTSNRFRGFPYEEWANFKKYNYSNKGSYRAPDMYLQIRNLTTGKVSPLSNGVVKYYTNLRYRPYCWYVEKNRH